MSEEHLCPVKASTAVSTNGAGLRRVHGSARADWPATAGGPEVRDRGPPAGQWFPQQALELARLRRRSCCRCRNRRGDSSQPMTGELMRTFGPRAVRALGTTAVVAAVFVTPGIAAAAPGDSGSPRFTAGATGAGDAYFPYAGAGGYDVLHYGLELRYSPPPPAPAPLEGRLTGTATIELTATSDLDRFSLDLRGLDVASLTIDGHAARELAGPSASGQGQKGPVYWQEQDNDARVWELTVQPRPKLHRGEHAVVVVHYGGTTGRPTDIEDALYGWVTTQHPCVDLHHAHQVLPNPSSTLPTAVPSSLGTLFARDGAP